MLRLVDKEFEMDENETYFFLKKNDNGITLDFSLDIAFKENKFLEDVCNPSICKFDKLLLKGEMKIRLFDKFKKKNMDENCVSNNIFSQFRKIFEPSDDLSYDNPKEYSESFEEMFTELYRGKQFDV